MWLSGGAKPDHNTIINDFRGKRLKEHLKKIFNQVVVVLTEQGVLNLRELTLDAREDRGQCEPVHVRVGQGDKGEPRANCTAALSRHTGSIRQRTVKAARCEGPATKQQATASSSVRPTSTGTVRR